MLIHLRRAGPKLYAELPPVMTTNERAQLLTQSLVGAKDNAVLDHPRSKAGRALLTERMDLLRRRGQIIPD